MSMFEIVVSSIIIINAITLLIAFRVLAKRTWQQKDKTSIIIMLGISLPSLFVSAGFLAILFTHILCYLFGQTALEMNQISLVRRILWVALVAGGFSYHYTLYSTSDHANA